MVRCEGDRLTLDVASMPLRTLLLEVGRQSGAQVRIEGLDERTVSEAFTRLPLDEAFRRLLGDSNFTLVYAGASETDGKPSSLRLKELRVYGGDGPVVSSTTAARPAAPSRRPTAAGPAMAPPQRAAPIRARPQPGSAATGPNNAGDQPQAAAPNAGGVTQDQGQDDATAEIPPGEAQPTMVDIGQAAVDAAGEEDPSAVAAPPMLTNPVSAAILGDGFGGEVAWQGDVDPEAAHEEYDPVYGPIDDGGTAGLPE